MPLYDVTNASTLSSTELGRLTVRGQGLEVKAKLKECGIKEGEAAAAVLMKVEQGKVRGSQWVLMGGLKPVQLPTHHLGGERSKKVTLDLGDLSKFTFPGDSDPRKTCNRSNWIPAHQLTTKITINKRELTDPKDIEEDEVMTQGFMVRLTVVPLGMGEAGLWLGAITGTPESLKAEAEKRGISDYDATVPTLQVSLGTTRTGAHAVIKMGPQEGTLIKKGWGMYPVLLVRITPGYTRDNLLYFRS